LRSPAVSIGSNPRERRVEVAFYQVPFPRNAEIRVRYVAMPEVRIVNVPTLRRVWKRSVRFTPTRISGYRETT